MLVRKVRGEDKIAKKRGWKWFFNKREVTLASYGGHHDRIGFVYKDTGLLPTQENIDNKEKNS